MARRDATDALLGEQREEALRFLSVLNRRCGRPLASDDLQDVAQDAMVALWLGLRRVERRDAVRGYSRSITRHAFCDELRSRVSRREQSLSTGSDERAAVEQPRVHDDVELALKKLSAREREIVAAYVWRDETFPSLASALRSTESAVKSTYYRSLRKLRRRLTDIRERGSRPRRQAI